MRGHSTVRATLTSVDTRETLLAFARCTGHDLRTPAAAVTANLEVALQELSDGGQDTEEWLARALKSVGRLNELLAGLRESAEAWPIEASQDLDLPMPLLLSH